MTETGVARDLMRSAEIKQIVRSAYAAVDSSSARLARKLYSPEELARMPQSAIERALGVGNHLRHAEIDAGETLLDLGCGAGIDTILAAQRTGPTGHVIALDFLPEMLERTKTAAAEAGLTNLSRHRLQQMRDRHEPRAQLVEDLLNRPAQIASALNLA